MKYELIKKKKELETTWKRMKRGREKEEEKSSNPRLVCLLSFCSVTVEGKKLFRSDVTSKVELLDLRTKVILV